VKIASDNFSIDTSGKQWIILQVMVMNFYGFTAVNRRKSANIVRQLNNRCRDVLLSTDSGLRYLDIDCVFSASDDEIGPPMSELTADWTNNLKDIAVNTIIMIFHLGDSPPLKKGSGILLIK
jgi:hypothetical protein